MDKNLIAEQQENASDIIARLEQEKKVLTRELSAARALIERTSALSRTQDALGNIIRSEKSKQEKYLNLLLENSPDIIMLFDPDGRFVYCTAAFLSLANISNFGLINGRHFAEVFKNFADEAPIECVTQAFFNAIHENRMITIDERFDIGGAGALRSYTIHISSMYDESGATDGAIMMFHDMTDVLLAKEQAVQASNAKSDFLAKVSHEIRTPMNAVVGLSDMIKKTALDELQLDYIVKIQTSSKVLLNLINDILDFSKIEAGKLELVEDYFSFKEMLEQLKAIFESMFEQKRVNFICNFDPALPSVVYGDDKRLHQVITNLLNNALKYTEYGHVKFNVYPAEDNMICFDVTDTGIGIQNEFIPSLFVAFEQLDKRKNKNIVGTGLGLAITKQLCDLMQGTISVTSTYGEGSSFSVRLRLEPGTRNDLYDTAFSSDFLFTAPNARVLLVDDIDINLMVAGSILESFDIVADKATNGMQAIEMAQKTQYDLILMDHMMPGMDGIEASQGIRELGGANADIAIVALTANVANDARKMFLNNGFNDFLSKPIDMYDLTNCLFKWLPSDLIVET